MIYQRNALIALQNWATKKKHKPLVLRGARQVGKTTLVKEFSKEFDTFLSLNLEDSIAASLFDTSKTTTDLLTDIYIYSNKARKKGKTLLFMDEIQNSPKAVARLRYFYEELPELYVIAAGSLLESLIDVHISFPVGRVEYLAIRPFSFNEFLLAMGETELEKAICKRTIPEALHTKAMNLFNTYTLIGGMPEIVSDYVDHRDLVSLNDTYDSLLTGYRDDVEKYSRSTTMTNIIRYILQQGWQFAAQTITLGGFANSNYKAREIGEAFRTLEKTMLLELVYPSTTTQAPIGTDLKRAPKLLWMDVGLVNYAAGLQKELFGSKDIADAWRGKIAEQIVGQELLTTDHRVSFKRNFWVRAAKGSDAEIDFIYLYDNKVIPIEVKSGNNAHLKSLHLYMDAAPHQTAIRIWSQPFSINQVTTAAGKSFTIYNIPFYYTAQLIDIIENCAEHIKPFGTEIV